MAAGPAWTLVLTRKQMNGLPSAQLLYFSYSPGGYHLRWQHHILVVPSLFSLWKHPHRYTQRLPPLKPYVFLNPIKLTIEINNPRLEKEDLLAISQQSPPNEKVVPTLRQRNRIGLSIDLIFSGVLLTKLS